MDQHYKKPHPIGLRISSTRFKEFLTSRLRTASVISTVLLALCCLVSNAQVSSNYSFATGSNASLGFDKNNNPLDMSTGTVQIYGANVDVYTATIQNLPFDFVFMGQPHSQFSCNPDGQLRFGTIPITGHSQSASANVPFIITNNIDGLTAPNIGRVHSKVFGLAPNRVFVIEWSNILLFWNTPSTTFSTYQLRLYEGTQEIEMVYGRMFQNGTSAQTNTIGFSSGNTSGFVGVVTNINTTPAYVGNVTSYTTTSFPATSDMANLNSTIEGARRFFRFTPNFNSVNGGVVNLSFSSVTAVGLTTNWEDNSTNETGFLIERSTNAAFTENYQWFTVPTTTSATTGTSYSLPQTTLTPGTQYFYRVYAIVEGAVSASQNGSQSTLSGATYYWTGATGGAWNTFSNWNTAADGTGTAPTAWATSDIHIIDGEGTTPGGNLTISVDRTSFSLGQFRVANNTNLTLQSSAATTRTLTIIGGPGDDFVIEAGSSLNLVNTTQAPSASLIGLN